MALKAGGGLQRWEIAVTKKLVGEFRRRSRSLAREEFDDLVQECLAHWIVVRRKLAPDPAAPPTAYMAQVVRNKLTDLIREQAAEKRVGDQCRRRLRGLRSRLGESPRRTRRVASPRTSVEGRPRASGEFIGAGSRQSCYRRVLAFDA